MKRFQSKWMYTAWMVCLALTFTACGNEAGFTGTGLTNDADARPTTTGRVEEGGTPTGPGSEGTTIDTGTTTDDLTRISLTYEPNELGAATSILQLDSPYLQSEIEMRRNYSPRVVGFTQVTRDQYTDKFLQGMPGTANEETFSQKSATKLDLLLVVDNSFSMEEEQVNLGSKLAPLLSEVNDSDWQIAITTTDPYDGCVRSVLKKGEYNLEQRFANAVNAGINGTGYERGLYQAVSALRCPSRPWVRSDSSLVILFVSDEDNCSDGRDCGGAADASKDYLIDYLSSIRRPGEDARVYGLIWHPSEGQDLCATGENQANIYADIIKETSGTWGSICAEDYSSTLKAISKDIASILTTKYDLQHIPDNGSVAIYVDGQIQSGTYNVQNNTINFDETPKPGSEIRISYRFGGKARFEQVTLSRKASEESISVTVNGKSLDPNDYSFNQATNKVHFASKPDDNADVQIDYRDITPLLDQFLLPAAVVENTLEVRIEGDILDPSEYMYDPKTFNVNFKVAPDDGAVVSMSYTEYGSEVLSYNFDIGNSPVSQLKLIDSKTGQNVPFSYNNRKISISQADWHEGKRVTLYYKNMSRDSAEVILAHNALVGSIEVSSDTMTCNANRVSHIGRVVNFTNCNFSVDDRSVTVTYNYIAVQKNKFLFDVQPGLDPEKINWTVSITGRQTIDFKREGWLFILPYTVPYGEKVEIMAEYEKKSSSFGSLAGR